MSMMENEKRWILAVAQELQQDGWSVITEPSQSQLPPPLHGFHPDIVAERAGERLVVEVKGSPTSELTAVDANRQVVRLAEAVKRLPDWSFRLIWSGDDPILAPAGTALSRAREAISVSKVSIEAGLLLAWSAAEGALLDALPTNWAMLKRRGQMVGLRLINEVYDLDLITADEEVLLKQAYRLRAPVAHGGPPSTASQLDVERISTWVATFLRRSVERQGTDPAH